MKTFLSFCVTCWSWGRWAFGLTPRAYMLACFLMLAAVVVQVWGRPVHWPVVMNITSWENSSKKVKRSHPKHYDLQICKAILLSRSQVITATGISHEWILTFRAFGLDPKNFWVNSVNTFRNAKLIFRLVPVERRATSKYCWTTCVLYCALDGLPWGNPKATFDPSAYVTKAKWVPFGEGLKAATICLMNAITAAQFTELDESAAITISRGRRAGTTKTTSKNKVRYVWFTMDPGLHHLEKCPYDHSPEVVVGTTIVGSSTKRKKGKHNKNQTLK